MKAIAMIAAMLALSATAQSTEDARLAATLQQLDRYLAEYEPKLSELIADEVFRQELPPLTSASARPDVQRRLDSEVAFARLPGDVSWIGFRRVIRVDGKRVSSSQQTLAGLLALGPSDRLAQAQLLVIQSSEHHLGLPRTINMPNLPLELLQPRYRSRFSISMADGERLRGRRTVELMFKELAPPSIVAYGERRDLLSEVQVWADITSGAILRARIRFTADGLRDPSQLDVEFDDHKDLGVLVPVRMDERFPVSRSSAGTGRATYTNFRRFQTSARVVPQ